MPFKKKTPVAAPQVDDDRKVYHFQLSETYEKYQPKSKDSNSPVANGYPPLVMLANEGLAYDPKKKEVRRWRLIVGQPSIWADEQPALEKATEKQLASMLSAPENQLEFIKGHMFIEKTQGLRLKAMQIQDGFEGNTDKVKAGAKSVYRLNNPDQELKNVLANQQESVAAQYEAMNASEPQMLEYAYILGIDVSDRSEIGLTRIRSQFVARAQENPANFRNNMKKATNAVKFLFHEALANNIITTSAKVNTLSWVETGADITGINSKGDVIEEICTRIVNKDKELSDAWDRLKVMYAETV